ncbi:N-acetylneuraminate lyase B-like [Physella acuta]|uniref:N-acetylneuraminate lyase B-like n=1 Tax=Physella acuta TaxID=109671 RepID=UPI0027DE5F23|nr:N-acetylneuraminate lyase B-like [Physella acuta]
MSFSVEGFVAATFTPFKDNGDVNLDAIDQYQEFLVQQGIQHVYINGTTGEGTSLTTDERKLIAEKWKELSLLPGRYMKVLIQVGGTSFKETCQLAEHAASIGADAISTLAPLYLLPQNIDELVDFCRQVAARAPSVPFYYYHIPDRTGVRFDMEQFLVRSRHVIPTLRGVKFSSKDLYEGSRCLRTSDAQGNLFDILFGCDEQVMSAFVIGFKGAIGSTYSLMAGTYHKLKDALSNGQIQEARTFQYRSVDLVKVCCEFGGQAGGIIPAMKVVLSKLGVDIGPPRFPMRPLSDAHQADLLGRLAEIGFFHW